MIGAIVVSILSTVLVARAGTTVWSGNFDYYSNVSDFDEWSWSDEVGEYQWYIHGDGNTTEYLALSADYKNPADTSETHGIRMTVDSTSSWEGQTMGRTELIPQTSEDLGTGTMYYHFSIMMNDTNPPDVSPFYRRSKICFFESHFTELQLGIDDTTQLYWMANSEAQWNVTWEAGTWYNFAYEINFDSDTVGLWQSTGSDDLTQVVSPVSATTSTNSEDWHLGVLRLTIGTSAEDFYFSGVYVESDDLTTSIGSGSSSSGAASSVAATTTAAASVVVSSVVASSAAASTSPATSAVPSSAASLIASAAPSASASAVCVRVG
ncbi:hypothetical protein FISHEDRAFT_50667 [Fistulina hepatica ATCC 64428]|uniref:Glycoside hydrolase 131 catalytic N-terminal domain-containing protein n=1 Tax=Fistulina hepatica ATCC 64428 TaxID=1128425 RepID=A0A0D7A4D1_9AGAR|nr:hypothetical protein FISHEDRAFT_50667 [Fistulina hepatica ATCC 64428]